MAAASPPLPDAPAAPGHPGSHSASRPPTDPPRRAWLVEHRPFLVLLALGVAVRIVLAIAFSPALMVSDSPTYLRFIDDPMPNPLRPQGYGLLLLYPVSLVANSVAAFVTVQHALGLATAVLVYVFLRRWDVRRWPAALATVPLLLDSMWLLLEHTTLSDTLFVNLVVWGVVALAWRRRPTVALTLLGAVLLGASVTVRQVGLPLIACAVLYCLLAAPGWRRKVTLVVVAAIGFAVPVGAYATWYQQENGTFALSGIGGKASYMRTTSFVECDGLDVPDYQRVLCPPEPRGERLDPTIYGWHDSRTVPALQPPPGTTADQAMAEFASTALRAQPVDYAVTVARDLALNFDPWRADRLEFSMGFKWRFETYVDIAPTSWTTPGYLNHGGELQTTRQPWAGFMVGYQTVAFVPGPVLLVCLVLAGLAAFGVGRARDSGMRAVTVLAATAGGGLMLAPVVTTQFIWRYQLPAVVLLPIAGALAWTALRGQRRSGTVATPSTD